MPLERRPGEDAAAFARRKVAEAIVAYTDAQAEFYPGAYPRAAKPKFGRPDGEVPLVEDEHVAHVAPRDELAELAQWLLAKDIGAAQPPRWPQP